MHTARRAALRGVAPLLLLFCTGAGQLASAQGAMPAAPGAAATAPSAPSAPSAPPAAAGAMPQAELNAAADQAGKLILAGEWQALYRMSQRIIDAYPQSRGVYGWRGLAALNLLRPREAVPDLLREARANPGAAMNWYNVATALLRAGEPDDALIPIRAGLNAEPGNDMLISALWDALDRKGDDAASATLRKQVAPLIADRNAPVYSPSLSLMEMNTRGSALWPRQAGARANAGAPADRAAASASAAAPTTAPTTASASASAAAPASPPAPADPALVQSVERGAAAWRAGQLEEAGALLRPALRELTARHGRYHGQTQRAANLLMIVLAEQMQLEAALGLISPGQRLDTAIGLARENLALRGQQGSAGGAALGQAARDQAAFRAELALAYLLAANGELREAVSHAVALQARAAAVAGADSLEAQWAGAMFALALSQRGQAQEGADFGQALLARAAPHFARAPYLQFAIEAVIGAAFQQANRPKEALPHLETALRGTQRLLGPAHRLTLHNLAALSFALSLTGAAPRALALQEEALAVVRREYGAGSPEEMTLAQQRAISLLATGKIEEAARAMRVVLDWSQERLGSDSATTRTAKMLQFVLYALQGQRGASTRLFRELAPQIEEEIAKVEGGDAASVQRFAPASSIFKLYASVILFRDPGESFEVAESAKARTLLESSALSSASRGGLLPPEQQARLGEANGRLAALEADLAATLPASREHGAFELQRQQAQAAQTALLADLKARYPKFREAVQVRSVRAEDALAQLDEDTAFISYVVIEQQVLGYGLSRAHGLEAYWLGDVKDLPGKVEAVRRRLEPENAEGNFDYGSADLKDLSTLLLSQFSRTLRGAKRVLISPDGPLAFLPFDLLTHEGQPLLQRFDVAYTPSLSVYALTRERARQYAQLPRKSLLSMGGAPYEAAGNAAGNAAGDPRGKRGGRLAAKNGAALRMAALGAARGGAPDGADMAESAAPAGQPATPGAAPPGAAPPSASRVPGVQWANLPGTAAEVQAVARIFPPGEVTLALGEAASESNLQQLNRAGELARFRYLHFAAHGYFDPEEPALSAVVLKQVGNPQGVDGFVTAAEWPGYNLKSDLIVMSACETGVGRYVNGSGVTGLPYALYVAGNTSLVLTLWQVADEPTQKFMLSFFTKLKNGVPKASALSQTKREFLADPQLAHPALWAGFVFYGE